MKLCLPLLLLALVGNAGAVDGLPDDSLSSASVLTDEEASDTGLPGTFFPIEDPRRETSRMPSRKELIPVPERLRMAEAEAARKAPQLTVNAER